MDGLPNAQQLLDLLSTASDPMDVDTAAVRDALCSEVRLGP